MLTPPKQPSGPLGRILRPQEASAAAASSRPVPPIDHFQSVQDLRVLWMSTSSQELRDEQRGQRGTHHVVQREEVCIWFPVLALLPTCLFIHVFVCLFISLGKVS